MSFPLDFSSMELINNTPTMVVKSLSGLEQRAQVGSQYFRFVGTLPPLSESERRTLLGFIFSQRGSFSTFTLTLPDTLGDASTGYAGTVTNPTASVAATSVTASCSSNTAILAAGDLFKFSNHNKVYVATAAATGAAGSVTISFFPALRTAQTGTGSITVNNVEPTVRIETDDQTFSLGTDLFSGMSLEFIEVIN